MEETDKPFISPFFPFSFYLIRIISRFHFRTNSCSKEVRKYIENCIKSNTRTVFYIEFNEIIRYNQWRILINLTRL